MSELFSIAFHGFLPIFDDGDVVLGLKDLWRCREFGPGGDRGGHSQPLGLRQGLGALAVQQPLRLGRLDTFRKPM